MAVADFRDSITLSAKPDADVTQYTFAAITAGAYQNLTCATATSGRTVGIFAESAEGGSDAKQNVNIATSGIGYLKVDGSGTAIAEMDYLVPTTGGVGIKTTTNNAEYGAQALEDSSAAGDIIRVRIIQGFYGAA
jgi:hypothetical protein